MKQDWQHMDNFRSQLMGTWGRNFFAAFKMLFTLLVCSVNIFYNKMFLKVVEAFLPDSFDHFTLSLL